MDNTITGKMSQKGQVVIPATIRKALGLTKGTELSFEVKGDEITIKKLPTALDWANLVKPIPVEDVEIDEDGSYDSKKSPEFHDWMVNG
ncbi:MULTISPECIES: AbrB/MazE/SpoVT family DNA-binding domain-containing protein [unclassified Lactobacillus]|uniref:AbrB/MazE/SpoVT family DNA-binding domain-containing protein n=1 Tax=unclassified Lactobacillus TaxID=2620435 RepID=UPI000EFCE767|nr:MULTISPECIES: AbrB/MazE/SpoVT family DNA-binding domain-containing protein [unclassified Lactobacillus]RMC24898.1 AbrB/MazE/SpoVT family DNA-binding domain-containing protein [Lactobacillus sp. ESL0247]RMC29052.1 AbrB/MazE/SpoVT family DNA-binding domain-containing protein [Lactobacillus sp. ESL0246]RMC32655.1 AbrB/MazE/SpoVT family DNA-binding domain-containing protein [Lactobacillus sp. ESL0245]RMC49557.1 AbrB/MazE/SpoVT family DNA-binding domain-containing protein [Lactobacillus sp. ESL02